MNTEKAYSLAASDSEKVKIENMYWRYSGYLVTDGFSFSLVDDEFDGCLHLPTFIRSKKSAEEYLIKLQNNYADGLADGRESFKRDLATFIKPK